MKFLRAKIPMTMQRFSFNRMSGATGLVAGVLVLLGFLIHPLGEGPEFVTSVTWVPAHALILLGFALSLLGLVGVHMYQSQKAGPLGTVGFLVLFVGIALFLGIPFYAVIGEPVLAAEAPEALEAVEVSALGLFLGIILLIVIGGVMFGVSVLRAGMLPRYAGALLAVSVVLLLVSVLAALPALVTNISGALAGISIAWLSYGLWSGKS